MSSNIKHQSKRRKTNGASSVGQSKFQKGNIISLRVWNFTTYNYGVFNLSPSLNMIIGPNGAGKSTFVAAVCLVLGGKIDLIRRKSLDSMIKSGEKESRIEITVCSGEDEPPVVIERVLTLKLIKSKWKVDGDPSDVAEVSRIVKGLNIQLDNLCHFLPQERVAEFASLSPDKLLLEMERTIGDSSLFDTHQLLIDLDQSLVNISEKLLAAEEHIDSLKTDVEKYTREAERFQEYEQKSKEIGHHKKLLPYAKLQDLRTLMESLKLIRDGAKKSLQAFNKKTNPLKNLEQDAKNMIKENEEQLAEFNELNASKMRAALSQTKKMSQKLEEIKDCKNNIDNLRSRTENQKIELQKSLDERDNISNKLKALTTVDPEKLDLLERKRLESYELKSKFEEDLDSIKLQATSLSREIEQNEQRLREERKKLDNNDRLEVLRSSGTRYRRELMEMSYKAHSTLRAEKSYAFKYFEAPVISCRVTDGRFAKYFEKIVDNMSLFALFFETNQQYQEVSTFLPKEINVPMRVLSQKEPEDRLSREQLKQFGFDGCLSDFVTGPEPIIRGLKQKCFIHMIPVALKPISPEMIQRFIDFITLRPGFKNARFAVQNSLFLVSRSKHGSKQTLYQTENIAEAQLMVADGLTEEIKQEIHRRIHAFKEKLTVLSEKRDTMTVTKDDLTSKTAEAETKLNDLDKTVRGIKKQKEAKLKLEDMLRYTTTKIENLRRSTTENYSEQISAAEKDLIKKYLEYSSLSIENSELLAFLGNLRIQVKQAELSRQKYENQVLALQDIARELNNLKEQLLSRYLDAKRRYDEYKTSDVAKQVREQNLVGEERAAVKHLAEKYRAQETLTELFVLQTIEQLQDEISVLANIDHGTLELLKSKRADLDMAEAHLPELQRKQVDLKTRITNISEPWADELSTIVETISQTFQKKFVAVASDGQVELVKAERFKNWKLEILVKFRENSELKVLDHQSQSGGERAVSTIFFIMSLQGLTQAPIRIVDEINQGMDPKNERMTHKYLVNTACSNQSSQYFLVTPKLLTGLYYHPDMAVHCIFTGPYLQNHDGTGGKKDYLNMPKICGVSN